MNLQSWTGFSDARFGYGAMLKGFVDAAPGEVTLNDKASVQVYMGVPMACKGFWSGQHRVLFSMWETTELPSSFQRYLPLFDQVLVPCEHNVEVFGRWHTDVRHVPLGVDTKFWKPMNREPNERFTFRAGGSLWRRKGLDALVKAFEALKLDAVLEIKAAPHAKDVPSGPWPDNVKLNREWMSPNQLRAWMNQADCFVAPARGEGFGLIPLQAIALGVPTIVSDTSGQSQFAHLASHAVGCRRVKADSVGLWDEPDQGELREAMLDVFRRGEVLREKARQTAVKARFFSWENAARQLVGAIPEGHLLDNPTWETAYVNITCQVIKPVNADIGHHHYKAKPGDTITIPDGAYQVLYDAGAVKML